MGPHHISETIIGIKLKFYTDIDRSKYSFRALKFPPLGGVRGVQRPLVQIWDPPRISETVRARRLKFYTHLDRTKCCFRARQFSVRVRRVGWLGGRPGGFKLQCPPIATFSSFFIFLPFALTAENRPFSRPPIPQNEGRRRRCS